MIRGDSLYKFIGQTSTLRYSELLAIYFVPNNVWLHILTTLLHYDPLHLR